MLAIRSLLKNTRPMVNTIAQPRNMSALSAPAKNKISQGEKLMLGAVLAIGWTLIPAWVLVNIKNYRHED